MFKTLLVTTTALILAAAAPALAQGRGNGGGGGGNIGAGVSGNVGGGMGNMGAGANMNGNGGFGGQSSGQLNAEGRANTNGPNAADRDFGRDRAEDRANGHASVSGNNASASGSAQENASAELGKLNSAHASANARENAAAGSSVGAIATYQTQMNSALKITDTTRRNAAITAARQQLAESDNKQLTPSAVARVDGMLGIQGASPNLGAQ